MPTFYADLIAGTYFASRAHAVERYVALRAFSECNGKLMACQMLLCRDYCETLRDHVRPTYLNFLYPGQRWQFSGLRLAEGE